MTTIEMDAPTRAFYAGVAKGAELIDVLEALPGQQSSGREALAYYWYCIGIAAGECEAVTNPDTSSQFMLGAALRQPKLYDEHFEDQVGAVLERDSDSLTSEHVADLYSALSTAVDLLGAS